MGQAIEQSNDNPTDQQRSEEEVVNNELKSKQSRPKWKRWKNQARETNKSKAVKWDTHHPSGQVVRPNGKVQIGKKPRKQAFRKKTKQLAQSNPPQQSSNSVGKLR